MPLTTQCTHCGVVLNLPDNAVGKRLKCPKCGTKFHAQDSRESSSLLGGMPIAEPDSSQEIPRSRGNNSSIMPGIPGPGSSQVGHRGRGNNSSIMPGIPGPGSSQVGPRKRAGASTVGPGIPGAGPDSSQEIPKRRVEEGLPVASGDLREVFDLPLASGPTSGPSPQGAADALALFEETRPAPRKLTGAEARAKARRCPTCGGVVPAGMSLCPTCGLDLETGTRVALDDDLAPPAPAASTGPPLLVAIIGGLCMLGSIAGTAVAGARWLVWHEQAWAWFIPVGLFAVYAAIHFLQGRSAKLLLAALTLGVLIDVVALIGLPIYNANVQSSVVQVEPDKDPDGEGVAIQAPTELLDTQSIGVGIALLIGYAGIAAYLCSPSVHRFLRH